MALTLAPLSPTAALSVPSAATALSPETVPAPAAPAITQSPQSRRAPQLPARPLSAAAPSRPPQPPQCSTGYCEVKNGCQYPHNNLPYIKRLIQKFGNSEQSPGTYCLLQPGHVYQVYLIYLKL
ncbi:translation initiation factor IF-2-like [Vidua chalybeata]|uniref:translation initiation factor IF-2-like n=1 Tax=Vidua chalybeata TaxID=81927 RepID=UPI0023A7E750|nr:translation initiation factor IF-2-like [Vidua chalybeata]